MLVFVMGAFVKMSGDVSCLCDIIAHELARIHVSYHNDDAKRTKGMYWQRTQKAWGHTAHRGWARLLLDRTRDLIIHGTAHRGDNGAAMPTDEGDHDGDHEWGEICCRLGAHSRCYHRLDPIPPTEVGARQKSAPRSIAFSSRCARARVSLSCEGALPCSGRRCVCVNVSLASVGA